MQVLIRMTEQEELRALPILLRHSPGKMLPSGKYVVTEDAAGKLREAGVQFEELSVAEEDDAHLDDFKEHMP